MFLKKLYQTNKCWFAFVVTFVTVQLAINIRQDVAISPVYHYGMYSQPMLPQKDYAVPQITFNGKLLQTKDFSPWQWDKISLPGAMFAGQQQWNSSVWNTDIKRLLHVTDSSKYVNKISSAEFNVWYKNYLQDMLHEKADSVRVDFVTYQFDGRDLSPETQHNRTQ